MPAAVGDPLGIIIDIINTARGKAIFMTPWVSVKQIENIIIFNSTENVI
jgi:hypothetical protein